MHSFEKRVISYILVLQWFFRLRTFHLVDLYVSPNVSPRCVWPGCPTNTRLVLGFGQQKQISMFPLSRETQSIVNIMHAGTI